MTVNRLGFYAEAYVSVKFVLWTGLVCGALVDAWRHRFAHPGGVNLHRVMTGSLAAFLLAALFSLLWGIGPANSRALYGVMVFMQDLGDAYFLGLLLVVASGFCITRTTLPRRQVATLVAFPGVNLATTLVVDYMLLSVASVDELDENTVHVVLRPGWRRTVFLSADFVRVLSLFYGWLLERAVNVLCTFYLTLAWFEGGGCLCA